jgi:hypothetical protein
MVKGKIDFNIKYNEKEFNKLLFIYCDLMNMNMAELVKKTARFFCKDMVQYTPPFSGSGPSSAKGAGLDLVARNKGRANVSRDVRRIFAPLAQAPAQQIAAFGNIGIFSAWMDAKRKLPEPHMPSWIFERFKGGAFISQGEFELFQKYAGNSSGKGVASFWYGTNEAHVKRVHEAIRGKPEYKVKDTDQKIYVDDFKVVENYIKRVQMRVGRLKSGWYWAGKTLGKMPTAQWIENQGSQDKICVQNLKGNKPTIRIGTKGRERYRRWWPLMQLALNHRAFVMRKKIFDMISRTKNTNSLKVIASKLSKGFSDYEE